MNVLSKLVRQILSIGFIRRLDRNKGFWTYRISANSFRGNYSFLNLAFFTVTFDLYFINLNSCRGNYSREETIQGRKLFAEIRYVQFRWKIGEQTGVNLWLWLEIVGLFIGFPGRKIRLRTFFLASWSDTQEVGMIFIVGYFLIECSVEFMIPKKLSLTMNIIEWEIKNFEKINKEYFLTKL